MKKIISLFKGLFKKENKTTHVDSFTFSHLINSELKQFKLPISKSNSIE